MKTLKMHGESDFTDISPKPDEREDSKESSGGLRDTLITQCEQEYENMINAVRRFSATEQYLINSSRARIHFQISIIIVQELTRQAEAVTVELNNNVMQNGAVIS